MSEIRKGWFADVDKERDTGPHSYCWQPCLETGTGHVAAFGMWFWSKKLCEEWIEENVLGVGLLHPEERSKP